MRLALSESSRIPGFPLKVMGSFTARYKFQIVGALSLQRPAGGRGPSGLLIAIASF